MGMGAYSQCLWVYLSFLLYSLSGWFSAVCLYGRADGLLLISSTTRSLICDTSKAKSAPEEVH